MNSKILIMNIKKEIFKTGDPSYILDGYKVFSQNDEDGIIQSIFKDIGIENKLFIEIGIGDGIENNSHNLILQNFLEAAKQTNFTGKIIYSSSIGVYGSIKTKKVKEN